MHGGKTHWANIGIAGGACKILSVAPILKQLLDEVFVMSRIIKVEV